MFTKSILTKDQFVAILLTALCLSLMLNTLNSLVSPETVKRVMFSQVVNQASQDFSKGFDDATKQVK